MTLNTYSHVLPATQEEAASKLDEPLTPIDIGQALQQLEERRDQTPIETQALPVTGGVPRSKDVLSTDPAPVPAEASEQRKLHS